MVTMTEGNSQNSSGNTDSLTRKAPAKINWFLEILRKRDDGYHEIFTLMQKIDFCDELTFSARKDSRITLDCDKPDLPRDENNLVVAAAQALKEATSCNLGADIFLRKSIPIGAGFGGGSSDAATTLVTLNDLWSLDASPNELHNIAAELGSDINFFLEEASIAKCEGRGEKVTPLENAPGVDLVVVWPGQPISSSEIYRSGLIDLTSERVKCNLSYTSESDGVILSSAAKGIFNRLSAPCERTFGFISSALQKTQEIAGERVVSLSGSGSGFYIVCEDQEAAKRLEGELLGIFEPPSVVKATKTFADHRRTSTE